VIVGVEGEGVSGLASWRLECGGFAEEPVSDEPLAARPPCS